MRFKVGDKVRVKDIEGATGNMKDMAGEVVTIKDNDWNSLSYQIHEDYGEYDWEWTDEMLEPTVSKTEKVQEDPLATKIEERNNKPQKPEEPWLEEYFEVLEEEAAIRPTHYQNTSGNGKDLFDEWYERYYHSNKRFTGREVFIEIMKSVAERYIRRYPNKNDEDILKGIETLTRLKQMEELEEENAKN